MPVIANNDVSVTHRKHARVTGLALRQSEKAGLGPKRRTLLAQPSKQLLGGHGWAMFTPSVSHWPREDDIWDNI